MHSPRALISFFYKQAEEVNEQKPGPMFYGFSKPPPLDVEIAWTETHNAFVPANFQKAHFLLPIVSLS